MWIQWNRQGSPPAPCVSPGYRTRLCPGTAWVASSPGSSGSSWLSVAPDTWATGRHGSGLETQGLHFCADHSAQLRLNIFICKMGSNTNTLFPGLRAVRQCVGWAWHAAWHEKCPLSDLSLLLLTLVPCLPCARPCADHFV